VRTVCAHRVGGVCVRTDGWAVKNRVTAWVVVGIVCVRTVCAHRVGGVCVRTDGVDGQASCHRVGCG
jgi:hypothetical protein